MFRRISQRVPYQALQYCARNLHGQIQDKVETAKTLTAKSLANLFFGRIMALRVPGFCPPEVREHALQNLLSRKVVDYQNADGVGKFEDLGMAYFEADSPEEKARYYARRLQNLQALRKIFSPFLSPIDHARLVMDEEWKQGAGLLNLGHDPMFTGLVRAVSGEILPHEDYLLRDDPSAEQCVDYRTQVAFNCYLASPESGGDLALWDFSYTTEEYDALRGDSYGIDLSKLPPPCVTIHPEPGELIAFNGRNLHAVRAVQGDELRVTVSGFILYQGEEKPLKFWS